MYDLAVLGGGPSGLTAAVYAARKKINLVLVSNDIGGQVLSTSGIENYMGFQFIGGSELIDKFEEQVKRFPIETRRGQAVKRVSTDNGNFDIETTSGEHINTKTVIVATGKRPRMLNVDGEERLRGRGVTYCAICDGPVFSGEKVAVVGGGNSALEAADDMTKIAEHVSLISTTQLTGDQVLIDRVSTAANLTMFLEYEVVRIGGEKRVEGITIRELKTRNEMEFEIGAVFIEIGLIPNSDIVAGVVELNGLGEIQVNHCNETGVPGLFAAGDVTDVPEKQIVVAAGEGAKAALQAHKYLQRL
ncbi:MAG: FAD-dependent oxidoreductase [Chloroflexota bacterium]|nr:FAD-dependent oxidoreductase [Chloroflexota bacterium]